MKVKNKAQRFSEGLIGTAYFPHWLSFLIDNPLRGLLISPAALAERLSLRPEARILEVDAGSGYFSTELAKLVPLGHLRFLICRQKCSQRRGGKSTGLDFPT
jgi:hypothetical protein